MLDLINGDRHGGDGEDHERRAGHGWGYDAAQLMEPRGHRNGNNGGYNGQAGHRGKVGFLHSEDADGDERRAGSDEEHVACAEAPYPSGLERRHDCADRDGSRDGPGQVDDFIVGGNGDDGDDGYGVGEDEDDSLQGDAKRHRRRAVLTGLVAYVFVVLHARSAAFFCRSRKAPRA